MTASIFTTVFLCVLIGATLTKLWLAYRQIRYVKQHRQYVPEQFSQYIDIHAHQRAADYTITNTRLNMIEFVVNALLILGLTIGGGINKINQILISHLDIGYVEQITLIVLVIAFLSIIDLPFNYYRQFVVEERFGFNKMTPKLFLSDVFKNTLISLIIALPLLFIVLWVMYETKEAWYLWTWGIWVSFQLLMMVIYPSVIAPIFNKFEPLQDNALKNRIEALMKKCGFSAKGLFVMDGSRRSAHGNAYFTGLGANKRIVFFDTLLNKLSHPQIEAVLAHELGHFKRRHILKKMLMIFSVSFVLLALLGYVSKQSWFYQGLGIYISPTPGLALLLFFLVLPAFFFFITPLSSISSRKHEFEADAFAAQYTDAQDLIDALVKLYEDNASTLTPDPIYSAFYYSHPPATQRIAHLTTKLNL